MSVGSEAKPPIKVLIVEDHDLTREGLVYGIGKYPSIKVIGQAQNGEEAVKLVDEEKPDVILMDFALPILNGIDATLRIKAKHPDIKILMLTSYSEQSKVFEAFSAGANGYCLKDVKTDRLAQIIEMLPDDVVWIDPSIASFILRMLPLMAGVVTKVEEKKDNFKTVELTAREKEILSLIAQGQNNREIAEKLSISLFTVKNHVSNIIQKLAVEDRTQAAIVALKKGLV